MATDTRIWSFTAVDTYTDGLDASRTLSGVIGFQATGTCNVVLRAEATVNETTWVTVLLVEGNTATGATSITVSGVPADKLFRVDGSGYSKVRVYVATYTSGTCVVRACPAIG